jgi:hypothetical protein
MWGTRRLKRQKQTPFGNDKQERGLGEAEALRAFDAPGMRQGRES